jgi:hypothetical protein
MGAAAVALVTLLIVGGCATDPAADPSSPATPEPSSVATPTASSTPAPTTTDEARADVTADDEDTDDVAGEPVPFFFRRGDVVGVVGVAYDDVLNVRAGPGVDQRVIGRLDPLGDATATGTARQLSRSIWAQIDTGRVVGWANVRFLGYLGRTGDVTTEVMEAMGDDRTGGTMGTLGRGVARSRASTDPPSDIVVVAEPTTGDLGEIVVDVIGLGDDAVLGLRLHVFGQPIDTDAGFDLKSVEETLICGRGVSGDGICT